MAKPNKQRLEEASNHWRAKTHDSTVFDVS